MATSRPENAPVGYWNLNELRDAHQKIVSVQNGDQPHSIDDYGLKIIEDHAAERLKISPIVPDFLITLALIQILNIPLQRASIATGRIPHTKTVVAEQKSGK